MTLAYSFDLNQEGVRSLMYMGIWQLFYSKKVKAMMTTSVAPIT